MKRSFSLLLGLLVALLGVACDAAAPAAPTHMSLFRSGDHGSKYYRIPAIITAADGSILAVADRRNDSQGDLPNLIDIVVRRSTDNGATWSDQIVIAQHTPTCGFGDAALVVDRTTGDVLCIYAAGVGMWASTCEVPAGIFLSRSSDHGQSWGEPRDITAQIYGPLCDNPAAKPISGLFAASGRAMQASDGALLFVVAAHHTGDQWPPLRNYVCRSDDGGETWRLLPAQASVVGDEAKIIETADGGWLMSIRNPAKGYRLHTRSMDGGATWSEPAEWAELPEPACNGDMIRYSLRSEGAERDILLHSIPADTAERRNVSIAVSYDEGRTWPVRRTVWDCPAGYSSLTRLADGSIGMLTEVGDWDSGFEIFFTRLTLDWLEAEPTEEELAAAASAEELAEAAEAE